MACGGCAKRREERAAARAEQLAKRAEKKAAHEAAKQGTAKVEMK